MVAAQKTFAAQSAGKRSGVGVGSLVPSQLVRAAEPPLTTARQREEQRKAEIGDGQKNREKKKERKKKEMKRKKKKRTYERVRERRTEGKKEKSRKMEVRSANVIAVAWLAALSE